MTSSPQSNDPNAPEHIRVPNVGIDWYRAAPWWRPLTATLTMSWRLSHLLICMIGLLATQAYAYAAHFLFAPEQIAGEKWIIGKLPWRETAAEGFFSLGPNMRYIDVWAGYLMPLSTWIAAPTLRGTAYSAAMLLGIALIWSLVGGCLLRRSIVEAGVRIPAPWKDTLRLVRRRWQSMVWAVTMPFTAALMLMVIPWILGWIANIPTVGPWIAGIMMFPVSLLSLAIGWICAISLFGFPLALAAIVTERKADAFDGVSRSAAYVFQRPVLLILIVALFELIHYGGGSLFTMLVTTGHSLVTNALEASAGPTFRPSDGGVTWMFHAVLPLILTAFSVSFFWCSQAALYLILRKDVDHAEYDLVDMDHESEKRA
ncbi:hypothetical protein VN12_11065 [Pirellula sp. SH-Sr6A]|uniref:hypothetical protein n=1 Tax=Pirellula sp. SH-Sr6A TaxID=1632865 RepID=UPI00078ED90E|nr:hypothetical protein [Pirellula sp. SH-Sr6A]AMV32656.1 hypothetical protein VN12_11065 [Pirellula sp. SH-Sr6A]